VKSLSVEVLLQLEAARFFSVVTVGRLKLKMPSTKTFVAVGAAIGRALAQSVPESAQIIDQKTFNVLEVVPPPSEANASTVSYHVAKLPLLWKF